MKNVLLFFVFKQNTFLSATIEVQQNQQVISHGLYGIVRHPMYTGGAMLFIGAPLLLGSIYGVVIGILLIILLAIRSIGEEKMLRQELDGYNEYMQKVKWRLMPFVF